MLDNLTSLNSRAYGSNLASRVSKLLLLVVNEFLARLQFVSPRRSGCPEAEADKRKVATTPHPDNYKTYVADVDQIITSRYPRTAPYCTIQPSKLVVALTLALGRSYYALLRTRTLSPCRISSLFPLCYSQWSWKLRHSLTSSYASSEYRLTGETGYSDWSELGDRV